MATIGRTDLSSAIQPLSELRPRLNTLQLRSAATVARSGFETAIGISRTTFVQVQALDSKGHVLSTSAVTHA